MTTTRPPVWRCSAVLLLLFATGACNRSPGGWKSDESFRITRLRAGAYLYCRGFVVARTDVGHDPEAIVKDEAGDIPGRFAATIEPWSGAMWVRPELPSKIHLRMDVSGGPVDDGYRVFVVEALSEDHFTAYDQTNSGERVTVHFASGTGLWTTTSPWTMGAGETKVGGVVAAVMPLFCRESEALP